MNIRLLFYFSETPHSVKHHMKHVMGTTTPRYEDLILIILVAQTETCVTAQPITILFNDPSELGNTICAVHIALQTAR
jgi:hypothetical protein